MKVTSFGILLRYEDFSPLNRWVQGFKDRHDISCRVISRESGTVDNMTIQDWFNIHLETASCYSNENIFSNDKAGLFFNLLSNRILAFKGEVHSGEKQSKEYIMVLFCTNMLGSNRHELLVTGKSRKPRCSSKPSHIDRIAKHGCMDMQKHGRTREKFYFLLTIAMQLSAIRQL